MSRVELRLDPTRGMPRRLHLSLQGADHLTLLVTVGKEWSCIAFARAAVSKCRLYQKSAQVSSASIWLDNSSFHLTDAEAKTVQTWLDANIELRAS